jgi:hypothetical protein
MPWGHRSDDMRDPPWRRWDPGYRPPCESSMSCGSMLVRLVVWALFVGLIVWVWRVI